MFCLEQEKIGKFIAKLRKEKGLTQDELGEKLSINGKTVSKWETGRTLPDISLLKSISDFRYNCYRTFNWRSIRKGR